MVGSMVRVRHLLSPFYGERGLVVLDFSGYGFNVEIAGICRFFHRSEVELSEAGGDD